MKINKSNCGIIAALWVTFSLVFVFFSSSIALEMLIFTFKLGLVLLAIYFIIEE